jgi:arabinose-5-phosphate isomerase
MTERFGGIMARLMRGRSANRRPLALRARSAPLKAKGKARSIERAEAIPASLASGNRTLALEVAGLQGLAGALAGPMAEPFQRSVDLMRSAQGRVIVMGIGKSGHVARKIAATLASTGTPASFVHPTEASHGDLGMITRQDVILALSWSGETAELAGLIAYAKRFQVPLIAMTSQAKSTLGLAAEIVLELPRMQEACPHGLAPTTSTTMQLALGDALAISLLEGRGFTPTDFKAFHPGGKLGARLKHVGELMHGGDQLPLGTMDMPMSQALVVMTEKSFGCIGIVDRKGKLVGIITDGDLRRHMGADLLHKPASAIMTKKPKVAAPSTLASAALAMLGGRITALFVVDNGKPVGILHVHDLLRAGVV